MTVQSSPDQSEKDEWAEEKTEFIWSSRGFTRKELKAALLEADKRGYERGSSDKWGGAKKQAERIQEDEALLRDCSDALHASKCWCVKGSPTNCKRCRVLRALVARLSQGGK